MDTAELRQKPKTLIDSLSGPRLREAAQFLAFVSRRDSDPTTVELLAIPGFERSYVAGERDIKAGRTKPWRKVLADV